MVSIGVCATTVQSESPIKSGALLGMFRGRFCLASTRGVPMITTITCTRSIYTYTHRIGVLTSAAYFVATDHVPSMTRFTLCKQTDWYEFSTSGVL